VATVRHKAAALADAATPAAMTVRLQGPPLHRLLLQLHMQTGKSCSENASGAFEFRPCSPHAWTQSQMEVASKY